MKKRAREFNDLVKAMKAWLDPDGPYQQKILRDLAADPVALNIKLSRPAPDGDFEIIFVKASEAEESVRRLSTLHDTIEILSFAEGMRLAQRPNCSGGAYIV